MGVSVYFGLQVNKSGRKLRSLE